MKTKSLILILIALGCGSVAAVGATQVLESRNGRSGVATEQILVAVTDIAINKQFDENIVKLEEWPRDRIPPGAIRTLEQLEGKFARQRLFAGEPIMGSKVMENSDTTAKNIPKGYRVISVKVSVDTSVAGLLKPGDKVDLIVFLRKGSEVPMTGTYRFLRNVTVFAVNSKTERSVNQEGKAIMAKTVSLLVTPTQAQKVALVSRLGSMHLSLRRPDDDTNEMAGLQGVTLQNLLTETEDAEDGSKNTTTIPEPTPEPQVEPQVEIPFVEDTPTDPADSWTMQLITPAGIQEVHWSDTTRPPDGPQGQELPTAEPTADPAQDGADDSDADAGDIAGNDDTNDTDDAPTDSGGQ